MKRIFGYVVVLLLMIVLTAQTGIASDAKEPAMPDLKLLESAAQQGDAKAMYELGKSYEEGVGVIQNYVQAHVWYNIASSRGYTAASKARDAVAKKMTGNQLEKAQELALNWKPTKASGSVTKDSNKEVEPEKSDNREDSLTGIEFVFVKGGSFRMGSDEGENDEKPVNEVRLDDYYIGKYEVTQGQWSKIMGDNPSKFKLGDNYPVENVSWDDIQVFLQKLSQKTGQNYRLPTEAEWEYAARSGGKHERFAGTSNESELKGYTWFYRNSGNQTHPVGQKMPNGLGIYDMSGNVWEWCWDWYGNNYSSKSPRDNPDGPRGGSDRVLRGGSWLSTAAYLRASYRYYNTTDYRYYNLGFRLARTP